MEQLLVIKQQMVRFFSKYEAYVVPVLRFILTLFALLFINGNIGFMSKLKNPAIVLILSLLCSFLPTNVIVVVTGFVIIGHVYSLSMNCAVVLFLVFVIMYALYFRFTPRDAVAAILTPIAFAMHVPYVIPLVMGFVGTPLSSISVGCGTAVFFMLQFIKESQDVLSTNGTGDTDAALTGFKSIIDGLLKNETMILMVIAFAITITLVYLIRRLSINYAWQIAMGVGAVTNMLVLLIGSAAMDAEVGALGVILGTILAVVIVFILQFFIFNVDYSRTEYVQFEDDEYYYYVKAIPKITLEAPNSRVRVNNSRRSSDYDDDDDYFD